MRVAVATVRTIHDDRVRRAAGRDQPRVRADAEIARLRRRRCTRSSRRAPSCSAGPSCSASVRSGDDTASSWCAGTRARDWSSGAVVSAGSGIDRLRRRIRDRRRDSMPMSFSVASSFAVRPVCGYVKLRLSCAVSSPSARPAALGVTLQALRLAREDPVAGRCRCRAPRRPRTSVASVCCAFHSYVKPPQLPSG